MEPSKITNQTLNKEFNLNPQQLEQAYSFQERVKKLFSVSDANYKKFSKYTNINTTTRFLQSKNFSIELALTTWSNWLYWNQKHKVDEIKASECLQSLQEGKAYWYGENIRGYPCLIIKTRSSQKSMVSKEERKKFFLYMLEKGCSIMDEKGVNKACIIWDRESGDCCDEKMEDPECKEMGNQLCNFYSDRIDSVYILRVGWFMRMIGSIIKSLVPKEYKHFARKINLLNDPSELLQDFTPENLQYRLGGKSDYEYKFDPDAFNIEHEDEKSF